MLKRLSFYALAFASVLAFAPTVSGQDAAQPESLSLTGVLGEDSAPAPKKFEINLPELPATGGAEEYFAYVDGLQEALPRPTSQEEMFKLVDALSQAYLSAANKILAIADLTPEQKERATQLKVVALTSRANVDPAAAKELDKFVDETLAGAKTTDELVKAYQLKLQVLDATEEDPFDKINALADEMYAREQEELQVFAIEVKAQAFLTKTQQTGAIDAAIFNFVDGVIADKKKSVKVVEKALEMKLVALVIASEIEKEKEEAEQDKSFGEKAEALFAQLLDGKYSADLKKLVYQLRLQSLNPQSPAPEDVAKIEDVAKRLLKEEDEQLQALGIAVKGQLLIQAAQKDPKAVPALDKYADEVLEQAKKNPAVKTQGVGMKIQAFRLKEDAEGLMAFIDAQLAEEDGALAMQLTQVKLTLISDAVAADASKFAKYAAFVEEAAKNEELAQAVDNVYSAKYSAAFSKLAEDGCTKAEFQALLAQFQAELEKRPAVVSALLIARESINQIGEKVGDVKLFNAAFKDTIEFCKNSKVEALAALGANLETYAAQMEQLEQAAPAEKAE